MRFNREDYGSRIRNLRKKRGLTQEQLAERLSLSPTHLSNIETGTTRVSLSSIVKIANALDVTVDDLLCDNLVQARPQFERDMQQFLDGCNPYEFRIAFQVAKAAVETVRANEKLKKQ